MLPLAQMPEHRKDLARCEVAWPSLEPSQEARHTQFVGKIIQVLERDGEMLDPIDLQFLRSAQVADERFWVWRFPDSIGEPAYAFVSERPNGQLCYGWDSADGLTPEQALLAEYHACY